MTTSTSTVMAAVCAPPAHCYPQEALLEALRPLWSLSEPGWRRARQFFAAAGVKQRHLAMPSDRYPALRDFSARNEAWIAAAYPLAQAATGRALVASGWRPEDIDVLCFVSVTGLAVPSIDALLVSRMGLRPDVKRLPIFGLGCAAGAAGLARLHDMLAGAPHGRALLVSVELCSLTLQPQDHSPAALVAAALFGDGAAAVLLGGAGHARPGLPQVVATRARLYPDSEHIMGWHIGAHGLKIVLSAALPALIRAHLRADVAAFLGAHGLGIDAVHTWLVHPGGPKVLEAVADALTLPQAALEPSWALLRDAGNLSSASVLWLLSRMMQAAPLPQGAFALLMAMGPGFALEMVLLRG